jgi:hypothetical protein
MTPSKMDISLDAYTVACTAEEIGDVLVSLLREMRVAAPLLTDTDRVALRQIMAHPPGTLTVAEVFPDFTRGSVAHFVLRRLRTAQFIRPVGRDMWERESRIDIKPFARLAWERLGEAGIFRDPSETGAVPELEVAEPEKDEIDLSLPGVNDPGEAATIRAKKTDAASWNDDDVLDYLKDDTKG